MTISRVSALALPLLLLLIIAWAVGLQIDMAIPFSAEHGPVEWLDTALLTVLTAITFGIGLFQRGSRRLGWWAAAVGLGLVAVLSLDDLVPNLVPTIDNDDYPMLAGWIAAIAVLLVSRRSCLPSPAARLALTVGVVFHSGAMVFDLLDDYLLPTAPGMAAGFIAGREIVELFYLGAYACAASLTVSRVIGQAIGDPQARRAGLSVPKAVEQWLGGWFKKSAGRKIRIAVENARWQAWRMENPGRSFADYYAEQIAGSLAAGQPHRTLGMADYSDRSLISGRGKYALDRFASRGFSKFAALREWNLRPGERVIDYGCGSLRVGQHLIRYLDRGNYIGLDVTDAFYRDGLQMLEPGLVAAKAPTLAVIDELLLRHLAMNPLDVVLSVAVVMHVPPEELATFFRRLLSLVGPATRAMIHVDVIEDKWGGQALRTAPKSWAYTGEHYRRLIGALRPELGFHLKLGKVKGRLNGTEWRHGIVTLTPPPSP
jgi:SAM-dependent methyltransferase